MQNAKIPHAIHGINGTLTAYVGTRAPGCFEKQKWVSASRPVKGYGTNGAMTVEIRFDDECKNGHNSFAITASVYTNESRRQNDIAAGGCMHEEIARVFPELAHLIEWHLCDTRGPWGYVENTLYFASNRKDSRYAPGEPCAWETRVKFGNFPVTYRFDKRFREYLKARIEHTKTTLETNPARIATFGPVAVHYKDNKPGGYQYSDNYTVRGYECTWAEAPFKDLREAREFCAALNTLPVTFEKVVTGYAEEKPRELDKARSVANWPEATDEQLCADPEELKAALLARLPAMLESFQAAIAGIGFAYSAPDKV